jgi:biotin carboxylase
MSSRPVAVLVDAYAAGGHLAPAFERAGAGCVHVQSTPSLIESWPTPDLSVYDANVVHEDIDKTVAVLSDYPVVCVVAGHEPGVLLADELSDAMGLPTNGARTARRRRNKYEMIEALHRAGLHCARQLKSRDAEEIADWARRAGPYPFVVKPLESGGTDGVHICHDADQVLRAATSVLGSTNPVNAQSNDEVLIQT